VIALTEEALEILRVNTRDMEADYGVVKRTLTGTCEACVDDSTFMNFRILHEVAPHTN